MAENILYANEKKVWQEKQDAEGESDMREHSFV